MDTNTSGSREIRHVIAVVAATVWKNQQSNNNSMSRSDFAMLATIPPGVRWGDLKL